ncbi:unnamed protein product, partial [Candidula unifasciata]
MAARGNWASLPSVVLKDIFSYLSPRDRIRASSVCHRWRSFLFLPQFWPVITFDLSSYKSRQRSRFLSCKCAKFLKEATIEFDSTRSSQIWDCTRLLEQLSSNGQLECITLRPSSCYLYNEDNSLESFLESLQIVVKRNRRLLHLSLGCTEIILNNSQEMLHLLVKYHASHIQSLHLSSIKENSNSYDLPLLKVDNISCFTNLRSLSLDYDFITPNLMSSLDSRICTAPPLKYLIIHVHRVNQWQITDNMWRQVTQANPGLELTLNLVHSAEGLQSLLDILRPSMPLAHIRQYFCEDISIASLNFISSHYRNTLRSLTIVEAIDMQPISYDTYDAEDPFVMLAWRCTRLESLKLIGVSLDQKDLVAIARLRSGLHQLVIPSCCVFWSEEDEDYYCDEDEALTDLQLK